MGSLQSVLFIINAPIVGGAELHTITLAEEFAKRNAPSTIFAIKQGPLRAPDDVPLLTPRQDRGLLWRLLALSRLIRRDHPSIIVAVNELPVLLALIARFLSGRRMPIVVVLHSTVPRSGRQRLLRPIYVRFLNAADGVIFVSRNQCDFFLARGLRPRNKRVIVNGVDLSRFSPAIRTRFREPTRRLLQVRPGELLVGICAVLRPEKNHLQLLRVLAALRSENMSLRLLIVGDGPMRPIIDKHIDDLGLRDSITVAGMHSDVRQLIASFDVGVLCSDAVETLPIAALEIMSLGIPMILSDTGGASEIVDGANGRVFEVGDDQGLGEAIRSLTNEDTRERAGQAARMTAEREFDQDRMIDRYISHLSTVCATYPPHLGA